MRFIIPIELRKALKENQIKLSRDDHFKSRIKGLIYKNKSISKKDLDKLMDMNIFNKNYRFEVYNFNFLDNLGIAKTKVIFNEDYKKLAEFIGIMLGDGNICRNNLRITIHKMEIQYKHHIKKLFSELFKLELSEYPYKNSKSLQLYRWSEDLISLLKKFGLKEGNKIKNKINIPDWILKNRKFTLSCLRGLIDTDGYLHYHKRDKQISVGFTNHSESLIYDFMNAALNLGFSFKRSGKDIRLYRKQEVEEFLNLINLANDRHLSKYDKFLKIKGAVV